MAVVPRQNGLSSRAALLDAAAQEFWEHGVEVTLIRDILTRARTGKGSIYHHFPSKEAIAQTLVDESYGVWRERLRDLDASGLRGLPAARRLCHDIVDTLLRDVRARGALRAATELAEPASPSEPFDAWAERLTRCLQQALADGDVTETVPLHSVATVIVDAVYGLAVVTLLRGDGLDVSERFDRLWRTLVSGLRPADGE